MIKIFRRIKELITGKRKYNFNLSLNFKIKITELDHYNKIKKTFNGSYKDKKELKKFCMACLFTHRIIESRRKALISTQPIKPKNIEAGGIVLGNAGLRGAKAGTLLRNAIEKHNGHTNVMVSDFKLKAIAKKNVNLEISIDGKPVSEVILKKRAYKMPPGWKRGWDEYCRRQKEFIKNKKPIPPKVRIIKENGNIIQ